MFLTIKYNNFTRLALIDGSVRVSNSQNKSQFIHPGQQATIYKENLELVVGKAALSDAILWTAEQLYFTNEALESILLKVGRWYGIQFIIEEPTIKHFQFTGSINKDDGLIHFLQKLQYTENINYTIQNNTILLNLDKS